MSETVQGTGRMEKQSNTLTIGEKIFRLVGPMHIVGGLLLFATAFSEPATDALRAAISGNADYQWSAFFAAVLGPTIASWGVLFTALASLFLDTRKRAVWNALLLSILVWAPLDTLLCLKFGILIGVVINSIVFVSLIGLLLALRTTIRP